MRQKNKDRVWKVFIFLSHIFLSLIFLSGLQFDLANGDAHRVGGFAVDCHHNVYLTSPG